MVKITVRYEDGLTNDIIIDDVMSVSNIINGILVRCKQNNIHNSISKQLANNYNRFNL